ncbi:Uu.00g103530.m01.CDS01 [Anthostomella pinea]|uniref:Uu.00g103530.m01.CDS01 n=1 Tax=Anthostomella pinea TaxID=933095 RepID=A0AAI8V8G9_9PEZI|nr:Uu.00g103530.m01.CDS01 [Anthostomella pinea]
MTETKEVFDLLIVGAGWHGLAMAKTYLEVVTNANIVILYSAESVGGTWASERLYPGLMTNNTAGSYEFSDFPMGPDTYGLVQGRHIPGEVVHRYLRDFADHYGLTTRIRFGTRVDTATLLNDGTWRVGYYTIENAAEDKSRSRRTGQLLAAKLVMAAGLTSEPFIPTFPGQDSFRGRIFHPKHLKARASELTNSRSVVMVGGNKSAWDVCYTAARTSGAQVHMVMRPSGGGPSWVWRPISILGGLFTTTLSRLSMRRVATWFDPTPLGNNTRTHSARRFLHHNTLSRWLCAWFWHALDQHVCKENGYNGENEHVTMLRPWTSTFWMGNSLSVHNYETDWFGLVRTGRVVPHFADVEALSETRVRLSDRSVLEADTIFMCMGWKATPTVAFSPDWIEAALRLQSWTIGSQVQKPPPPDDSPLVAELDSDDLQLDLDIIRAQILEQCPVLKAKPVRTLPTQTPAGKNENQTTVSKEPEPTAPIRLYRFMVPASSRLLERRNHAFIGAHVSIHAVMLA